MCRTNANQRSTTPVSFEMPRFDDKKTYRKGVPDIFSWVNLTQQAADERLKSAGFRRLDLSKLNVLSGKYSKKIILNIILADVLKYEM